MGELITNTRLKDEDSRDGCTAEERCLGGYLCDKEEQKELN